MSHATQPFAAPSAEPDMLDVILDAVSTIFASLGRALVCLGPDFRVVHASVALDELVGEPVREKLLGRPAEEIWGRHLFGENGLLRESLLAGELREGWGTTLRIDEETAVEVSTTVAPLTYHSDHCDPRVAYFVAMRPHQLDEPETRQAPTIFCGLVTRAASMLRIFQLIEHLKESEATVLVTGESGTGKELVAKAIHRYSPRADGPFVAVNCGAIPSELLESELFGHVRGAFTGAVRDRVGRFEAAAGGTFFLDEVGDLPLHLQVKLLRVLQERTFERVGETETRSSDARILTATHHDLYRAVAEGRFREDLYYRLRVVPIEIPPLRARREDVEPLAHHLLDRITQSNGRSLRFAPDVVPTLLRYDWPGNVRELENALEFAVAVCQGQTIHVRDLPPEVVAPCVSESLGLPTGKPGHPPASPSPAPDASSGERDELEAALEAHHWRRDETARALGMSRTTLWRKMREHGLID